MHGHESVTAQQAGVLSVSNVDQGMPWASEVCVSVEDRPGSIEGIKHGLSTSDVISVLLCCAVRICTGCDMTASYE